MNDDFMLNLFRQREKEILKKIEGTRLLKSQHAGDRKKRKEIWGRRKSIMVSWKRDICRKASLTREMMGPLHHKDQTMQRHPEL